MSLSALVNRLENSAKSVAQWFEYNYLTLNVNKCKLIISGNKEGIIIASVGETKIIESHQAKLDTYIDRELNLNDNVDIKCKNAARILNALMRLGNILPLNKRRVLMKAFIESQFAYAPLLNLYHRSELNNKINALH